MESTDADLVHACLEGEARAWGTLVERHGPLVWAIARRTGLAEDDAADVVQTTFVTAWRNLDLLERPGALPGWLATIARREAWRLGRKARQEGVRRVAVDEAAGGGAAGVAAEEPLADEELLRLEGAALLDRGIARLDAKCRALVRLLFYRDPPVSYADAAAELGMPIGGLGPTRARCLTKLKRILGRLAPDVSAGPEGASGR